MYIIGFCKVRIKPPEASLIFIEIINTLNNKIMQPFYVINYNINKQVFEPYNIMEHFISEYKKLKKKPKTVEEIKEFIKKESVYTYWSRTEYEIILVDWPCQKHEEKWDIYKQILMNIDIIVDIFIKNIKSK